MGTEIVAATTVVSVAAAIGVAVEVVGLLHAIAERLRGTEPPVTIDPGGGAPVLPLGTLDRAA